MITVGGLLYPNLTTTCDWESKGVAIYDLSTLTWGSVYAAGPAPYQVPAPVVQSIGGTANGSAAMTRPQADYASQDLATLFHATLLNPPAGTKLSGGAVAGVAVGASVVGLLLVAATAFFVRRRHRRRHRAHAADPGPPPVEAGGVDVLETDGHIAAKEAQASRGPFAEMDVNPPRFDAGEAAGAAAGPLDEKRAFGFRAELGPEAQVAELPAGWLSRSSLARGSGGGETRREESSEEGTSSRGASPEGVSSCGASPEEMGSPEVVSSPEGVSSPTAAGSPLDGDDVVSELGDDERSHEGVDENVRRSW